MQNTTFSSMYRLAAIALTAGTLGVTGCGLNSGNVATAPTVAGVAMMGSVHGGQQPVSGAAIQLYAASAAGYGATSFALLNTAVTTGSGGSFTITGDYSCPSSTAMVYIVATGGNPGNGNGAVNSNLAMMATLGQCGNLTPSSFVNINELTTVSAVYALQPFMTAYTNVGTSATNPQGLVNAVANSAKLVNATTGSIASATAQVVLPTAKLNTLADILAACVNSAGGSAGDGSACGRLFTNTTPPGSTTAPTDTIGAALNIARFPANNDVALFGTVPATAPFMPTMTAASDFTVAIKYTTGTFSTPSAAAIDPSGNLWVTNAGSNTVSVLQPSGLSQTGSPYSGGGLSGPSGVAIDASGNAWIVDKTSSKLSVFTPAGAGTATTVTGLSAPTAVAIDGRGLIWVTNSGNSSVTSVTATGTTVNSSSNYTAGGVSAPVAIAIDPR